MNILTRASSMLLQPVRSWSAVQKEKKQAPAVGYVLLLFVIGTVFQVAVYLILLSVARKAGIDITPDAIPALAQRTGLSPAELAVFGITFANGILVLSTFVNAAFLHLAARLVGTKGTYRQTYQAVAYGLTPSLLFCWIPVAKIITPFWAAALQIIGLQRLHAISLGKAIGIAVLGAVMFTVIMMAVTFSGILAITMLNVKL